MCAVVAVTVRVWLCAWMFRVCLVLWLCYWGHVFRIFYNRVLSIFSSVVDLKRKGAALSPVHPGGRGSELLERSVPHATQATAWRHARHCQECRDLLFIARVQRAHEEFVPSAPKKRHEERQGSWSVGADGRKAACNGSVFTLLWLQWTSRLP
jgi:hypothetical protein